MIALLLHLTHGIQSSFQTFGLNNDRTLPITTKAGNAAAVLLFLGYISVPILILIGLLNLKGVS
jgi:succinate dehydrogenase / fumarate reductase cytochrome b subunit